MPSTVARGWQIEPIDGDPEMQITSVGGTWAVLDVDGAEAPR